MPNCAFNAQFGPVEPYVGISILGCVQVLCTSVLQFTLINGLIDFLLYFMVCAKIILGTVGGEHSEILFTHVQIAYCSHDNIYFFNFLV